MKENQSFKKISFYVIPLFIAFSLIVLSIFIVLKAKQISFNNASNSVMNTAKLLAQQVNGILTEKDNELKLLIFSLNQNDREKIYKKLHYFYSQHHLIDAIAISDEQGNLIRTADTSTNKNINISNRLYFQKAKASPDKLIISRPLISRNSGEWIMVLARAYRTHEKFSGVAIISIKIMQLGELFQSIDLGSKGIINLRAADYTQIIRQPLLTGPGKEIGNQNVSERFKNLLKQFPEQYAFSVTAPIDNTERVYAYQKFKHFPYYMTVGRAIDDFGTQWKTIAILLSVFDLFIIALIFWRSNNLKKQLLQFYQDKELSIKSLTELQERYKLLFDHSPEPNFLMDCKTGKTLDCNKSAEIALGADKNQIIGKTAIDFSPRYQSDGKSSSELAEKMIKSCLKKGQCQFQWLHKRFNGTRFYTQVSVIIITIDNKKVFLVTWQDLTDIKLQQLQQQKLQQDLERAKHRIAVAVDSAKIGIWEYDVKTNQLFWDDWMYKIYGVPKNSFTGAYDAWSQALLPEDKEKAEKGFINALIEKRDFNSQFRIRVGKGEIRWVQSNAKIILDDRGDAIAAIGTNIDITEDMNLNQKLRNLSNEANQANQAKSDFLANMSHEIRTPMNGIIGMVNLMLEEPLPKEQYAKALTIKFSAESLLTIINDILDFSKIESGKLALENIAFDLSYMLKQFADSISYRIEEKGLEFICPSIPLNQTRFIGDAGRLRQILFNLVGNAIKFTEKGEIEVKVDFIEQTDQQVKLLFEIRDTGIGLKSEQINHLFERFTQEDCSTTRKYGGTGLGLAISKEIVTLMGGEIGVESEPGKGSRFWFTVNLKVDHDSKEYISGVHELLYQQNILVVDDNETNRELLHQILNLWKIPHTSVESGQAALEAINQAQENHQSFSLGIIDMQMPEMDGLQLGKNIIQDIPRLLLLSSQKIQQQHISEIDAVFNKVLMKPIHQSELYDAILELTEVMDKVAIAHPKNYQAYQFNARVLVVEDNITNQEVAKGLFYKYGIDVTMANNGVEALEYYPTDNFDVIFMDCNMPIMDGYTATRKIREREAKDQHVPIIAMTANAMQKDIEKSLSCGMDDHISKPISHDMILNGLIKWLPESCYQVIKSSNKVSTENVTKQTVLKDSQTFDRNTFISSMSGDIDIAKKVAETFLTDLAALKEQLFNQIEQKNADKIRHYAHQIKGAVTSVTAVRLGSIAFDIENQASHEDYSYLSTQYQILETEFEKLTAAINQFIKE